MVAMAIQQGKVRVNDEIMPEVHPAALLFPTVEGTALDKLVASLKRDGPLVSVVMTPDGLLLEGRGRWKGLQRLGTTPITRIERSDPWLYILSKHREQLDEMSPNKRAMTIGKVPAWSQVGKPRTKRQYSDPPTVTEISEVTSMTRNAIVRAQEICSKGVKELQELVSDEKMQLYTAYRVAQQTPAEQREVVRRVRNGENPHEAAPIAERTADDRRNRKRTLGDRATGRDAFSHIRLQGLRTMIDAMASMKIVLEVADGLDPSITADEAAQLTRELANAHIAYTKLIALLRARKEEK